MFKENVNLLSFCCSWLEFFLLLLFGIFSSLVMQSDECEKIVKKMWCSQKKVKLLRFYCNWERFFFCGVLAFSEKLSKLFSDSTQLKKKVSNVIWRKWKNCRENVMFEEKVTLLSFTATERRSFWCFWRNVTKSDLWVFQRIVHRSSITRFCRSSIINVCRSRSWLIDRQS